MISVLSDCCCEQEIILYKFYKPQYLNFYNIVLSDWLSLSDYDRSRFGYDFDSYYNVVFENNPELFEFCLNSDSVVSDCKGGYASQSVLLGCDIPFDVVSSPLHYHWCKVVYYYGDYVELFVTPSFLVKVDTLGDLFTATVHTTDLTEFELNNLEWF